MGPRRLDGADRHLRRRRLGLLAALIFSARAHADDRVYPLAITDRPILLPTGVTELDVSVNFPTYVDNGHVTGLTDHVTSNFGLTHAFDDWELGAGIGRFASLGASIDTHAVPAVITLSAVFSAPQLDHSYYREQDASIAQKWFVRPRQLAFFMRAGVALAELDEQNSMRIAPSHVIGSYASALCEVQLGRRLGLYLGANGAVPLTHSETIDVGTGFGASADLLVAFQRWDVSTSSAIFETRGHLLPSLYFGVAHRWGL